MRNDLEALLGAYRPESPDESRFLRRMEQLLGEHAAPFSRKSLDPGHFTASAFVLGPDLRSVLLIHHRKLNRWLQPGGHIEPSDAGVLGAARREVYEETGLSPETLRPVGSGLFDLDIHAIPGRPDEPTHLHFDLRMAFQADDAPIAAGDEVHAVRWEPLDRWGMDEQGALRRVAVKLRRLAADR